MKKLFTKIWKLMKICAGHVAAAVIFCAVSAAHDNHAQILERKITLNIDQVSIETALKEIEVASGIRIFYSIDQLSVDGLFSVQAQNKPLRAVLDDLLGPLGIGYKVDERKGIITLKRWRDHSGTDTPLQRFADEHDLSTITGTVLEATTRQPMAGVNVLLKGTTTGTSTDADGKYTIDADNDDIMVFSFIGYTTFETPVNSRTVVDVELQPDVKSLGEVVINAGYWTVTDRERTGNISRVTAEDIKDQPVSNPLMAIQGRMPGVTITQTSGVPGSGMKIQIRGQNSLRTYDPETGVDGNYPLYVIDGVPVASNPVHSYGQLLSVSAGGIDPLNTLNPSNIESIEILKDADATAIYGSRGANGVVLITTKKGKSSATGTNVDLSASTSVGQVSKMMDVMSTEQYLAMRSEAFANDGTTPGPADYDLNGIWTQSANTNWQEKLIGGTASISDIQGAISGGNENTSFRFGGGYHKEGTVFPGDFGYKKMTGFLTLSHATANQKFRLSLSVNYGQDEHDLFDKNIASYALTLPPNAPDYDEHGDLEWIGYTSHDDANPLSYFKTKHNSETGNLISSAVISYEIVKGLHILTNLGFNDTHTDQVITSPKSAINPSLSTLSKTLIMESSGKNWIAEPQVTYTRHFRRSKLNALLGSTWQATSSAAMAIEGQGYVSDGLLGNISAASSTLFLEDSEAEYRYQALFARLGYVWLDKFLLNLTARRDGSSRFGKDKQFGTFGALGAGWIFTEEPFLKNLAFLNFGKLRLSYGTTGSDQIGNYGYLSTYSISSRTYRGLGILNPTSLSNPDFAWEINKKLEAAIDLSFLQNRIRVSTSWYRNRSSNQLVGYPLPGTTGFSSVQYNLDATVENTGWEFGFSSVNIEKNNFRWTTSVNLTVPRNKLISYPNLESSSYANRYVVGQPLSISKRYQYAGVDPETGLYQVVDQDGNGSYSASDRQAIVDYARNYYGGFQSAVRWRAFDLSMVVEYVNQEAADYLSLFFTQPGRRANQLSAILKKERWRQEGDAVELQKFTQISSSNYSRAASSNVSETDASFIRLKTISLAYNLPSNFAESLKTKGARVYVQAQNLFTITDYFGFNPESPYLELPPLRVIGGGFELNF